MEKIFATIEKTPDGYDVFMENGMFSGVGETPEAAKADMAVQMQFYADTCKELGYSYPAYLDTGEYEIFYKFDTMSLLRFYEGIISLTALGHLAGINAKQLWKYAHGITKPRPQQIKKIEDAFHRLGKELSAISL